MNDIIIEMFKIVIFLFFYVSCFGNKVPKRTHILNDLKPSEYSYIIQDADSGEIIKSHNETKLFPTASTVKILTAQFALEKLGVDYKFKTKLCQKGSDLYIVGSGDPSFVIENLYLLAHKLKIRGGLEKFKKIYYDDSIFESFSIKTGRKKLSTTRAYNAHVSGLNLNYNSIPVHLFKVNNKIKSDNISNANVSKVTLSSVENIGLRYDGNKIVAYGNFPSSKSEHIEYIKAKDPSMNFAETFNKILGVNLPISSGSIGKNCTEVVSVESRPVGDIIKLMNKFSNNLIAEALVKKIDSEGGSSGKLGSGVDKLRKYLFNRGFDPKSLELVSPSGLNPTNKASARALNNFLLNNVKNRIDSFTLLASMPIAGVDGTLRKIKKSNFLGKTGYINGVASIAGFYKGSRNLVTTLFINSNNKSYSTLNSIRSKYIQKLKSISN